MAAGADGSIIRGLAINQFTYAGISLTNVASCKIDGDFLGEVSEIEFEWEPDVLELVVPDGRAVPRPPPIL